MSTTARAPETLATIRAFYAAAVRGPGPEREAVRTGIWYVRVLKLHSSGESRAKIESVQSAFHRLQAMWTVDKRREESATMRAAWESGDRVAFFEAVLASRQLDSGHGPHADGDLFAMAMGLRYGDRPAHVLARSEARIPAHLDTQERDTERMAEDRGLLCQISNKASHIYWASQAQAA